METREKLYRELKASGVSTREFFRKAYQEVIRADATDQMLQLDSNEYDHHGKIPHYVYRYFDRLTDELAHSDQYALQLVTL